MCMNQPLSATASAKGKVIGRQIEPVFTAKANHEADGEKGAGLNPGTATLGTLVLTPRVHR